MLQRFSIIIGGQSGTGINTVGIILAKAFKRSGYFNTSYREYPSLIKGGFASYKIDISDNPINSVSEKAEIYIAIDKWSFQYLLERIEERDILIYDKNIIRVNDEQQEKMNNLNVREIPLAMTLTAKKVGGNTIMKNTVLLGAVWNLLGLKVDLLVDIVTEKFNKTEEIIEANKNCTLAGAELLDPDEDLLRDFQPKDDVKDKMSIAGNEAIALGAITAGVRSYFAYPMTPSTSILHTISKFAEKTGIVVKQAEDEITAVNMTIGANHAGTRAMTATSGGGFDLMAEGLSLAGITEIPLVVALAQRPGPGTGVPTWTAQADLNIALYSGHGAFARILLAPGDVAEGFELTAKAHNLAEKYQCVVIILTDKYLSETMFTAEPFDQSDYEIDRGDLVREAGDEEMNRYELTDSGVSTRWLPGDQISTFVANSDEHDVHGHSTEGSDEVRDMINKRLRKIESINPIMPAPERYGPKDSDLSIITWGSSKYILLDSLESLGDDKDRVNLMHFSHIYPLRTEELKDFIKNASNLMVMENNETGQFADLIQKETGMMIKNRFLKYNSRPFFVEEVVEKLKSELKK